MELEEIITDEFYDYIKGDYGFDREIVDGFANIIVAKYPDSVLFPEIFLEVLDEIISYRMSITNPSKNKKYIADKIEEILRTYFPMYDQSQYRKESSENEYEFLGTLYDSEYGDGSITLDEGYEFDSNGRKRR